MELATTLKWFSTTLLNVLKDVPGQPFVMMRSKVGSMKDICWSGWSCDGVTRVCVRFAIVWFAYLAMGGGNTDVLVCV